MAKKTINKTYGSQLLSLVILMLVVALSYNGLTYYRNTNLPTFSENDLTIHEEEL